MFEPSILDLKMWGRLKPDSAAIAEEAAVEMARQKQHCSLIHQCNRITNCIVYSDSVKGRAYWINRMGNNFGYCHSLQYKLIRNSHKSMINGKVEGYSINQKIPFILEGKECSIQVEYFMEAHGELCVYGAVKIGGTYADRNSLIPIKSLVNYTYDAKYKGGEGRQLPNFKPEGHLHDEIS